jgi:hypothetical protein
MSDKALYDMHSGRFVLVQVPKAMKEAPPSPSFSPMQTSDLGSSETK